MLLDPNIAYDEAYPNQLHQIVQICLQVSIVFKYILHSLKVIMETYEISENI